MKNLVLITIFLIVVKSTTFASSSLSSEQLKEAISLIKEKKKS